MWLWCCSGHAPQLYWDRNKPLNSLSVEVPACCCAGVHVPSWFSSLWTILDDSAVCTYYIIIPANQEAFYWFLLVRWILFLLCPTVWVHKLQMVMFTAQKCESVVGVNCQCRLKEIPPCIFFMHSLNLLLSPSLSIGAVVLEQDSAAAQQYSRQGCPTGLRADLWALILNSTNQPQVRHTHSAISHSIKLLTVGENDRDPPTMLQGIPGARHSRGCHFTQTICPNTSKPYWATWDIVPLHSPCAAHCTVWTPHEH